MQQWCDKLFLDTVPSRGRSQCRGGVLKGCGGSVELCLESFSASLGGSHIAVVTPKDLKKMAKKAKGKSKIVAPGSKCASDSERPGTTSVSSELNATTNTEETAEKPNEDCFLSDQPCGQKKKPLQPGEYEIVHQGTVDLSELFGEHSQVRKAGLLVVSVHSESYL